MKVSLKLAVSMAVLLCFAGCSLISLKSPERPLSSRDLNARILTRDFSYIFIATVQQCADDISARETDPKVRINTLRWKISAAAESQRAANRVAPMMGLLDTWALAAQMQAFLSPGSAGDGLFGVQQEAAFNVAKDLDENVEGLARRLLAPPEFRRYRMFVQAYTRDHPLESLELVRASVVELWSRESGASVRLVDSVGTIPEAMADASERLQMYSDTLPALTMWKTQLALQESGYSGSDIPTALQRLDDRLSRISAASDNAQQALHGVVADARQSMIDVLNRLDASSATMIEALRTERQALSGDVRTEREALTDAADTQRKAIVVDVDGIADRVLRTSGEEVRHLAREVLLLLTLLTIVLLGLPFSAGYVIGRARSVRTGRLRLSKPEKVITPRC